MIPGLVRFLTGIMFVSGYGLLGRFFPSKYLVSDEYAVRVCPNLNPVLLYLLHTEPCSGISVVVFASMG